MAAGAFKFEDDPLKHYVRTRGWLPLCRERHRQLQGRKPRDRRRLRYFTFCAVNAVDVLMLDVAKVIRPSAAGRFDTVCFFDRTVELVAQTQLRVPGSIGFAGSFVETVLTPLTAANPLASPAVERDTAAVRRRQVLQATKRDFIDKFPFDVLNLDLEDLIFKARDTFPGDVIRALRQLCEWQRRPLVSKAGTELLDGFTLLFTTRVGPAELREDYAQMLITELEANVAADGTLVELLRRRNGLEVGRLQQDDFVAFFELGVPKVIAKALMDEDWHIDPNPELVAFRFTRTGSPSYEIVHFAMNVRRQSPRREDRAPGTTPPHVMAAYKSFARGLFERPATLVNEATVAGSISDLLSTKSGAGGESTIRTKWLSDTRYRGLEDGNARTRRSKLFSSFRPIFSCDRPLTCASERLEGGGMRMIV